MSKFKNPIKLAFYVSTAALLLAILFLGQIERTKPKFKNLQISTAGDAPYPVKLPWSSTSSKPGARYPEVFSIGGEYLLTSQSQSIVRIIPDDCITELQMNDQNVPLNELVGNPCDYNSGVTLNLSKRSHQGANTFQLKLVNNGGPAALDITSSRSDLLYRGLFIFFSLFVLLSAAIILGQLEMSCSSTALILTGLMVSLVTLFSTPMTVRSYDIGGHLDFIRYVSAHLSLPNPDLCWECHQQPLYYFAAGFLDRAASLTNLSHDLVQQSFILVLYFGFVCLSVKWISETFLPKSTIPLAVGLFVLWPAGFLHSVRVGNDVPFYLWHGAALLWLSRWTKDRQSFQFTLACLFAGLATLTKLTGLITVTLVGLIWLFDWLPGRERMKEFRRALPSFMLLLIAIGMAAATSIKNTGLITRSSQLNSAMGVKNTISNYLFFNPKDLWNIPYTATFRDEGGRQFFWQFFMKSSLFGEFQFPGQAHLYMARGLTIGLCGLIILCLFGIISLGRQHASNFLVHLFNLGLGVFAVLMYRATQPFSCNQDFRYMFPIVASMSVFVVLGLNRLKEHRLNFLYSVSAAWIGIFGLLSIAFYLSV